MSFRSPLRPLSFKRTGRGGNSNAPSVSKPTSGINSPSVEECNLWFRSAVYGSDDEDDDKENQGNNNNAHVKRSIVTNLKSIMLSSTIRGRKNEGGSDCCSTTTTIALTTSPSSESRQPLAELSPLSVTNTPMAITPNRPSRSTTRPIDSQKILTEVNHSETSQELNAVQSVRTNKSPERGKHIRMNSVEELDITCTSQQFLESSLLQTPARSGNHNRKLTQRIQPPVEKHPSSCQLEQYPPSYDYALPVTACSVDSHPNKIGRKPLLSRKVLQMPGKILKSVNKKISSKYQATKRYAGAQKTQTNDPNGSAAQTVPDVESVNELNSRHHNLKKGFKYLKFHLNERNERIAMILLKNAQQKAELERQISEAHALAHSLRSKKKDRESGQGIQDIHTQKEELLQLSESLRRLDKHYKNQKKELVELSKKMKREEVRQKRLDSKIKHLQYFIETGKMETRVLRKEIERANANVMDLEAACASFRRTVEQLNKMVPFALESVRNMKTKSTEKNKEIQKMSDELRKKDDINCNLVEENQSLESDECLLKEKISKIKNMITTTLEAYRIEKEEMITKYDIMITNSLNVKTHDFDDDEMSILEMLGNMEEEEEEAIINVFSPEHSWQPFMHENGITLASSENRLTDYYSRLVSGCSSAEVKKNSPSQSKMDGGLSIQDSFLVLDDTNNVRTPRVKLFTQEEHDTVSPLDYRHSRMDETDYIDYLGCDIETIEFLQNRISELQCEISGYDATVNRLKNDIEELNASSERESERIVKVSIKLDTSSFDQDDSLFATLEKELREMNFAQLEEEENDEWFPYEMNDVPSPTASIEDFVKDIELNCGRACRLFEVEAELDEKRERIGELQRAKTSLEDIIASLQSELNQIIDQSTIADAGVETSSCSRSEERCLFGQIFLDKNHHETEMRGANYGSPFSSATSNDTVVVNAVCSSGVAVVSTSYMNKIQLEMASKDKTIQDMIQIRDEENAKALRVQEELRSMIFQAKQELLDPEAKK